MPNWLKIVFSTLAPVGAILMQVSAPHTIVYHIGIALVGIGGGAGVLSPGVKKKTPDAVLAPGGRVNPLGPP